MHRDTKIGLSLGLLLIVIVAALFFRRQPESFETLPPLADADAINQQIAEREQSPYAPELDNFPAAPAPAPPPSARQNRPQGQQYRVPGFLTAEDEAANRGILSPERADVPDPIPTSRNPAQPGVHSVSATTVAGSANETPRTHVIQAGDTLSSIAHKYLGTSARFHEVYNANRSVLKSPNVLPEGATIQIPSREPHDAAVANSTARGIPAIPTAQPALLPQGELRGLENLIEEEPIPGTPPAAPRDEERPVAQPAANPPAPTAPPADEPRLLSRPSRRTPFSAGRVSPADRNRVAPATEPEARPQPTQTPPAPATPNAVSPLSIPRDHSQDTRGGLPQINVGDHSDLLDPENERIAVPAAPTPAAAPRDTAVRPTAPRAPETESLPLMNSKPKTWKVQRGDTLDGIAIKVYGRRNRSADILKANSSRLKNAAGLQAGMELVLPE